MIFQMRDKVDIGGFSLSENGYLEGNARTGRAGVQQYHGSEVGRPDLKIVTVYRDASEVFKTQSLNTFSKLPITIEHPQEAVTSENWKDYAVGTTGDEVLRDGEYLKIGLKITDAAAVRAVQDGKRQLSVGYTAEIDWVDGATEDGIVYQAKQSLIAANHIAIVDAARAGPQARIGDELKTAWGEAPVYIDHRVDKETIMPPEIMQQTVVLGDAAVTVPIDQAPIIDSYKKAQAAIIADAEAKHSKEMALKDAELAKKDAEIKELKDKQLDDAALDKRVTERSELIVNAKLISDKVKTDSLSDADIRKATVTAILGEAVVKDQSEAYIDARFDILVEDSAKNKKTDKIADAIKQKGVPQFDNIYDARDHALSQAWNPAVKKEA